MRVGLCLLLVASPLLADQTAADCEEASIQTAIDAATDGEVVNIPDGSCTWTSASIDVPAINIGAKGIHLKGGGSYAVDGSNNDAGTWPLTITLTDFATLGAFVSAIEVDNPTAGETVEISGIKFTGTFGYGGTNPYGVIGVEATNTADVLVHDNLFDEISGHPFATQNAYDGGQIFYKNYVYNTDCQANGMIEVGDQSEDAEGNGSWTFAPDWGGTTWLFVEDNTFWDECGSDISTPNNKVDTLRGGRFVWRYNWMRHSFISNHGSESGASPGNSPRGGTAMEVYNNTMFGNDDGGGGYYESAVQLRSGSGRITDNTVDKYQNLVKGWNPRVGTSYFDFGQCDVSPPDHDGDIGGGKPTGYPCLDQVGRTVAQGTNIGAGSDIQPQTLDPLYIWSNSVTDVAATFKNNDSPTTYMTVNEDYYLSDPGDYTKYTYPHPLRHDGFLSLRVAVRLAMLIVTGLGAGTMAYTGIRMLARSFEWLS